MVFGKFSKSKAKESEKDTQKPQLEDRVEHETASLSNYEFHPCAPATVPETSESSQALVPASSTDNDDTVATTSKGKEKARDPAMTVGLQLAPYPAAISSADASDNPYLQLLGLANMFREAVRTLPRSIATFRAIMRCPNCWVQFPVSFSTTVEVPQGCATVSTPPPPAKVPPKKDEEGQDKDAEAGPSRCYCEECGEELPSGDN